MQKVKKSSTLILKAVLIVMALAMLALCIFFFPDMPAGLKAEFPAIGNYAYFSLGFLLGAIPFFFVIYQAFLLLVYVDKNIAFSEKSVRAFKNIKYSGIVMTLLYLLNMPVFFQVAEADDAPGVVLFGFIFCLIPAVVVSTFAGVMEKLFQNAIDIKSENDLTV